MTNNSTRNTSSPHNDTWSVEVVSSYYGSRTEIGNVREHNEDSLTVLPSLSPLQTEWGDMKQVRLLQRSPLTP